MIEFDLELPQEICEPRVAYSINRELNLAWNLVEETGANLYLTGKAGTGKTTFLKKLRESSSKRMVVLAPTGVAAINARGTTLHSFFQLPFSLYIPGKGFLSQDKRYHRVSKMKNRLIASLSLLVIDEISMVRPDVLDGIDEILRRQRRSSLPFGGLQLLLIGDLRQLPPVVKDTDWEILKEHYNSPYFFESHALKAAGYETIELSVVYRQQDPLYLEILNHIRDGHLDTHSLAKLNTLCYRRQENEDDKGFIRLTTHNQRASLINESKLDSLTSLEFTYEAETDGVFPETSFPVLKNLRLKEGAQVMFVKNDTGIDRKFYNGLIGTVETLSDEKVSVRLPDDNVIEVEKAEWENLQYVVDEATNEVRQEKIGTFRQYPLQLAWAITIHKSQGLTFDKAIIDASNSFAPGQTYVALSRCRSLEGLRLDAPIPLNAVITDRGVNDFVAFCENNAPDTQRVDSLKRRYVYSLFLDLFDFEPLRRGFADFARYAGEYLVPVHPEIEKIIEVTDKKIEKDICEVARRFTSSFNEEELASQLSATDSLLKKRIKMAGSYYVKILSEIFSFFNKLPKDISNLSYATRLENVVDQLLYFIQLKRMVFSTIEEIDFTVNEYLEAKANAVISLEREDELLANKRTYAKSFKAGKVSVANASLSEKDGNIDSDESSGRAPKQKTAKKPKGYSTFETLKLFRAGKTIQEIAMIRNLAETTIGNHLYQLIQLEKLKVEDVVDETTIKIVSDITKSNPDFGVSQIKEFLIQHPTFPSIPYYLIKICKDFPQD